MNIELYPHLKGTKLDTWKRFMENAGLNTDTDIDSTVLIYDGENLIASGSRKDNILKYIAVDPSRQGEGLTASVLTSLRKDAFDKGYDHLFLYTKPENETMFKDLFFLSRCKNRKCPPYGK